MARQAVGAGLFPAYINETGTRQAAGLSGFVDERASVFYTLAAAAGSITLTGENAAIIPGRVLSASDGSFALTGENAALIAGRKLSAATGAFVLTGENAGLIAAGTLVAAPGSFALTGENAALTVGRVLAASAGSFALTGEAISIDAGREGSLAAGSFALTGENASLRVARVLSAAPGSFSLSGQSINITVTLATVSRLFPYLALVGAGTPFNGATMNRQDLTVISASIRHDENDIPSATVEIRNPRQGLLNLVGSSTWAWISWKNTDTHAVEPLFFGRLVAVPADMLREVVTLRFSAQPSDFLAQKQAIAAGLQVQPYYDPVFFDATRRLDPDAALEGYSALWHVDRITNAVTVSDVLAGEDGTIEFVEGRQFYDDLRMSIDRAPLKSVFVNARVTWTQQAVGTVDLGQQAIKSYSDNILSNWPKPRTSLGAGWTVSYSTAVDTWHVRHAQTYTVSSSWRNREKTHQTGDVMSNDVTQTLPLLWGPKITAIVTQWNVIAIVDDDPDGFNQPTASAGNTSLILPQWLATTTLVLRYEAKRDRTENVRFTLGADVQPVFSDPGGTAANFAQDSELIDIQGSVGLEGPYGTYRGDWGPGTQYFLYDYFTVTIDGIVRAFSVTRDHVSLGSFDQQATATLWEAGQLLGAGENVFYSGEYYAVNVSHVAGTGIGGTGGAPPLSRDLDGDLLFSLIIDPHSGPRLYQTLPGFRGNWTTGTIYVPNDIFIAPSGTQYLVAIGHTAAASFDKFATDTTGRLLLSELLNPAPIGDLARRSYFPTDRGLRSLEYLILRARAQLCFRSRVAKVSFEVPFVYAVSLSCRKNAKIDDRRIPGGSATGKVIGYELAMPGGGNAPTGKITIGCAVGNGNTLTPSDGTPTYVDEGYFDPGEVQYYADAVVAIGAGDVGYTPPLDAPIDDGLIFPLDKVQAVVGETVQSASVAQEEAVLSSVQAGQKLFQPPIFASPPAPPPQQVQAQLFIDALAQTPTWYKLTLKPVVNGPFDTEYDVEVPALMIPKQFDTSAAAI